MSNFFIKWKGIESGPFSGEEIRGMFETGKIGLLHEIRAEGENEWFLLKDFDFSAPAAGGDGVKKGAADDLLFAAYFLCGASFLHPLIYLASAALCVYAYKRRSCLRRRPSRAWREPCFSRWSIPFWPVPDFRGGAKKVAKKRPFADNIPK